MERADFGVEHVSNWQVIVCKQCRCAVWPSEVAAHLTNKQQSRTQKSANSIGEEVEQWQGVIQYPSGFDVPSFVTEPVQELPLSRKETGWGSGESRQYEARREQTIRSEAREQAIEQTRDKAIE